MLGTADEIKDELISNVVLWTPTYRQRGNAHMFDANTGCSLEDLLRAMGNRNG